MENICRTCMLIKEEQLEVEIDQNKIAMLSIFMVPKSFEKEYLSIKDLIRTTVPQLKIDDNDQLPKVICQICLEKITDIYSFQKSCVNIEEDFHKMFDRSDTKDSYNNIENLEIEILTSELKYVYLNQNNCTDYISNEMTMEAGVKGVSSISNNNSFDSNLNDGSGSHLKKLQLQPNKVENRTEDKLKIQTSKKFIIRSKKSNAKEIYPCDKCGRKLSSNLSFEKHKEKHLIKEKEEQELKCNICKQEFSERFTLKQHRRMHEGNKPFLCCECGKVFATAGNLKQHTIRHSNKKPFSCPDCPKTFTTKNDLFCHYDIHKAKPRIHVCEICERGFHKPSLLKQHQRFHNNDKQFSCEFCEKRFVTNEKLQRHRRIHTGEKPFKCKYCDKAFTQSNDCIKHLRKHLGVNVYQCELCPLRFPFARDLRAHFASHKNDNEQTRARNLEDRSECEKKLQLKFSF